MTKTDASSGLGHQQSLWLDSVRAMGAIAVFLGHARGLFLVDGAEASLGPAGKALYYLTGFGHQSVVVFFVLSGFLVGGSALRADANGRFSLHRYAVARASRMYAVVVPALMATALLDSVGAAWGGPNCFYAGQFWGAHLATDYSQSRNFTLAAFVGNLFFLQTIAVPTFGSNHPLWSLANEALYYAIFPAVLLFRSGAVRAALCGAIACVLAEALGASFGDGFLFWTTGAGVAWLGTRFCRETAWFAPWMGFPGLLLLCVALHATRVGWIGDRVGDMFVAAAFLVSLAGVVWNQSGSGVVRLSLPGAVARTLADMSFSLYVMHFPVLVLISALTLQAGRLVPTVASLAARWLCVLFVGVTCWLFSLMTEKKTDRLRTWLSAVTAARLGPPSRP